MCIRYTKYLNTSWVHLYCLLPSCYSFMKFSLLNHRLWIKFRRMYLLTIISGYHNFWVTWIKTKNVIWKKILRLSLIHKSLIRKFLYTFNYIRLKQYSLKPISKKRIVQGVPTRFLILCQASMSSTLTVPKKSWCKYIQYMRKFDIMTINEKTYCKHT